jgi:hypothetical protein
LMVAKAAGWPADDSFINALQAALAAHAEVLNHPSPPISNALVRQSPICPLSASS